MSICLQACKSTTCMSTAPTGQKSVSSLGTRVPEEKPLLAAEPSL